MRTPSCNRSAIGLAAALSASILMLAAPALASNTAVRRTFAATDARFNTWWSHKAGGNLETNATAADAEAARLTIAATSLAVTSVAGQRMRLGRSLARQAFTDLAVGCRAWSAFETDQIGDPQITQPQTLKDAQKASDAFTAGRPLLAAAARDLGVKIVLYRFAKAP